jgi:protein-tyrosine phosphatase
MNILVVCLGNICRSPTAEAALREAADAAGVDIAVESAGTSGWHVGSPPDPRMTAAARDVGLRLDGSSRQVTVDDLDAFDLVLAMDRDNLTDLRALADDDTTRARIRLFREFDPEATGAPAPDVPDPYYGGEHGFTEVVDIVRRTAQGLIEAIDAGRL